MAHFDSCSASKTGIHFYFKSVEIYYHPSILFCTLLIYPLTSGETVILHHEDNVIKRRMKTGAENHRVQSTSIKANQQPLIYITN